MDDSTTQDRAHETWYRVGWAELPAEQEHAHYQLAAARDGLAEEVVWHLVAGRVAHHRAYGVDVTGTDGRREKLDTMITRAFPCVQRSRTMLLCTRHCTRHDTTNDTTDMGKKAYRGV
jgi:hypothetical protein